MSSSVKIISECFIKPKTLPEIANEPYHLQPFEHVMLSYQYSQMGLLFLKPSLLSDQTNDDASKPEDFMETWLQKLKDSLAATLVYFYPLVGRLKTLKSEDARSCSVFVDCCNSPGAGFIHAKSDLSIADIVDSKYVPLVVQSFFDHHEAMNGDGHTLSLLTVKVTELVDGVFIGASMNHSVGDGISFSHFVSSVSDIFNSNEGTIGGNNKALFRLKNPPIFREMSGPHYALPYTEDDKSTTLSKPPVLKERIFRFSSETVRSLKLKANQDCGTTNISSFQSLTAFVWRSITRARKLPYDEDTRCSLAADNRSRMDPPLPMTCFGVYVSYVKTTMKVGSLLENAFGWAALKLHQAVIEHDGEKISSQADEWLKSPKTAFNASHIVHMGSSPRFDKYGCEFGMGKAIAVRSGYGGKFDGKVIAYPGREGRGSIDLEVCLPPAFMEALESDQEFMSLVSS